MKKKKVFCLYRVSTKKQLSRTVSSDNGRDEFDIPMQKNACLGMISNTSNWELYRELSELGVSGYKVSAKERDAIQEIQQEALAGQFDVLLVFMFDRLGRIDDETPFIVEWFVKHGIEVWSVKEGEQRFETHVDKLTNYIRFWQASGESEKTSIRTKESSAQMVKEGRYRGGGIPYGYMIEKQGRINKRGHEVHDIKIDESEAAVVRHIFELYTCSGYGSHRISTHLTKKGVLTRKKDNFTSSSINSILSNRAYIGVLKSGESESEIFPDLAIIEQKVFDDVQEIKHQRSLAMKEKRHMPLHTSGNTLLSGNIFCGHCGARLVVTTNNKTRTRKDGSVKWTPRKRYVCYNKTRHKHKCNGQTGYTTTKLDAIIDEIARSFFGKLSGLPKEALIEKRFSQRISEHEQSLLSAKNILQKDIAEMMEYEDEVLKVIRGDSKFDAELLSKLHQDAKQKVEKSRQLVKSQEDFLLHNMQNKELLAEQFDEIKSWADMYDCCALETKKMILSRLFSSIKVKRDYEIEIDVATSCEQLGIIIDENGNYKTKELEIAG